MITPLVNNLLFSCCCCCPHSKTKFFFFFLLSGDCFGTAQIFHMLMGEEVSDRILSPAPSYELLEKVTPVLSPLLPLRRLEPSRALLGLDPLEHFLVQRRGRSLRDGTRAAVRHVNLKIGRRDSHGGDHLAKRKDACARSGKRG